MSFNLSLSLFRKNTVNACTSPTAEESIVDEITSSTLGHHGYIPLEELTKTLQGSILKVCKKDGTQYVVKAAQKALHNKSLANVDGYAVPTQEDILRETQILKYLTSKKPPIALIKYIDRFSDGLHWYLVMEFGGNSLFDFVKECHQYIAAKIITIREWHKFCKYAMNQMVDVLSWLHNDMCCCHFDLSLENFTIKNALVNVSHDPKSITLSRTFEIKLIDFGLAEVFRSKKANGSVDFKSTKYVGKTGYLAPKVYAKKRVFDARSADCWSLAICFFIMFLGHPPWKKPSKNDELFKLIYINGYLVQVLENWGLIDYVTADILNLLMKIFRSQKHRLTIREIKRHCFLTKPMSNVQHRITRCRYV